jgi:signal peptidase II
VTFFAIVALGLAADLSTKYWAFQHLGLPGGQTDWLWQDRVGLQTSLNEGALFGLGHGGVPVFVTLSVVAFFGILVWLFYAGAARNWFVTIALGCVNAGLLGNLYDRLALHGLQWPLGYPGHEAGGPAHAVRDFILVMIGTWAWPNFNLADSLLVCGAILLIAHAVFFDREGPRPAASGG